MSKEGRKSKGFSTVLMSAIMLSSISAMGVTVLGFSDSVVSSQQGRISELYVERSNALQEIFIMEDVWFDGVTGSKQVHVTIKNVGQLPIKVTSITINVVKYSTNQLINPDQSATIDIDYGWTTGLHDIVVQTERGNTLKQSWMP